MHHIPNLLCVFRLAMAPLCALWIVGGAYGQALALFCVVGFTDFLDGYLARRMDWRSAAGAYLDPLADKALLVSMYIALGIAGIAPLWLVGLIFGRDVFILLGAAVIYWRTRRTRFPPTMAGKVSTTLQMLAAVTLIAVRGGILPGFMEPLAIVTTAGGTLYSGLDYVRLGSSILKQREG